MSEAIRTAVLVCALVTSVWAVAASDEMRVRLCPEPQQVLLVAKHPPMDPSRGLMVYNLSSTKSVLGPAVARLAASIPPERTPGPPVRVVIGPASDWSSTKAMAKIPRDMRLSSEDIRIASELPADGYLLRAREDRVWIIGRDIRGTAYGVQTLAELVRAGKPVPALTIKDWPSSGFRAAYTTNLPTDKFRSLVDTLFRYKLNYVVIESDQFYRLSDPEVAKRVKADFDYCRSVGIEPIPELQSFGWGFMVLGVEPICAESLPWNDRLMVFGSDDVAVPAEAVQVHTARIANEGFESGSSNQFYGWEDIDGKLTEGRGQDGSRCALLSLDQPGIARISQTFEVKPHRTYELSVDMRTEAGSDYIAYFEAYEGSRMIDAAQRVTSTTDWQRRSMTFKAGDSPSITVYLRIQQGVGKAWFDNVQCRTAKPLDLVNLIVGPKQPLIVTSDDGRTTYKEARDYTVTPGKLAPYPYKLVDAVPWKLTRVPGGRILTGSPILVSAHWVPQDSISYCPSEPKTRQIMKRAITQTMRLVKPQYLHIGHDEPRIINRDGRCKARNMRAHEIFADDVRRLRQYARSVDPKVRLMMWADVLDKRGGEYLPFAWDATEKCTFEEAVRLLPKDVVMCGWWYDPVGGEREKELAWLSAISDPLLAASYDTTISPWFDLANTYYWGEIARKSASSQKLMGWFLTTWDSRWAALPMSADMMWNREACSFPADADTAQIRKLAEQRYAGFEMPETR